MSTARSCPNCGKRVVGHPNKRFCRPVCKDRYHNRTNPRGYGLLHRQHGEYWLDDDTHPFSDDAVQGNV